jgi:hypothetical protein
MTSKCATPEEKRLAKNARNRAWNKKTGYRKISYYKNHDAELQTSRDRRAADPEKKKKQTDAWFLAHPGWKRDNENKRLREDPTFKMTKRMRNNIWRFLKGRIHSGPDVEDVGCTREFLISYLETKFHDRTTGEKMTWDNWSSKGWHVDHIIDLTKFNINDRTEFRKANHYTNLQPLWAEENRAKNRKGEVK